ncbi:MAG TPA: suppressor of fused domain protein [Gemmataceae bacterium]|nr:suppressor of fused domain protein [Gemmataceae bacterium]
MGATGEDDWEAVWDARADALAAVLGPGHDQVYHARHPFALGGQADVIAFFHHLDGIVYVTAELTGKPEASYADYELMVCHRSPQDWGPDLISRLAPYTQQAYIGAGESMDIDSATPAGSRIKALLFNTYARFTLFGQENELRLCLGITKPELEFKLQHGAERLLGLLKRHGVYPFTDLERDSVPLDD